MQERQCARTSEVRMVAVTALVLLICGSGGVFAQASLSSEDPGQRLKAVYATMQRQSNGTSGDMLVRALKDSDPNVREIAAVALGKMKYKSAVVPLEQCLADPDVWVRAEAATALGKIGDERVVDALIQAASDSNPWVRSHAVAALGDLGSVKGLDILMPGLKCDQTSVVEASVKALVRIGMPTVSPLLEAAKTADGGPPDALAEALAGSMGATSGTVREALNDPNSRVNADCRAYI